MLVQARRTHHLCPHVVSVFYMQRALTEIFTLCANNLTVLQAACMFVQLQNGSCSSVFNYLNTVLVKRSKCGEF